MNFVEIQLEKKKLLVQPFPVTNEEFQKFLKITEQVEKEKYNSDQPEKPVRGISYFDAVLYANYISELQGFPPAYSIQEIPYQVVISGDQGYRLFTWAEWQKLVDFDKEGLIRGLKGLIWQWTETSEKHPWDQQGQTDPERPNYQWTYQLIVGGSDIASNQFLQGYPTALILPDQSFPRLGFRLIQGSRNS
ncbi:MAG: SUMF1/EgtB/PvdO family nonheme iron enzyme [bacterium]